MGKAIRTTILPLDLAPRQEGGANLGKRHALEDTVRLLEQERNFYIAFFLARPAQVTEQVEVVSAQTGERELRLLSAHQLLTWAEAQTLQTADHPEPLAEWNFTQRFPTLPSRYRRSVLKDAIGKVRGYLSHLAQWQQTDKKKGKPGRPGAAEHPTLYQGTLQLELAGEQPLSERFVRLKVYARCGVDLGQLSGHTQSLFPAPDGGPQLADPEPNPGAAEAGTPRCTSPRPKPCRRRRWWKASAIRTW